MRSPHRARVAAVSLALGISALFGAQPAQAAGPAYVALGDSYSSGVGAGNYDSSSGNCKRSNNAYPVLWKNANAPSSFSFVACSGAVTDDVLNNQLGALDANTGLVSISIGGNDAGFADVMTTCVLLGESSCVSRVDEARSYVRNTLPGKLDQVYDAIRAKAPNAKVVVMGYPRFYKLNGECWIGLSETSRAAINAAADDLADVIANRAAAHGFVFGDVRSTFSGHELCSGDPWLHSVELNVSESYHPTAEGQSGGYYPVLENAA